MNLFTNPTFLPMFNSILLNIIESKLSGTMKSFICEFQSMEVFKIETITIIIAKQGRHCIIFKHDHSSIDYH